MLLNLWANPIADMKYSRCFSGTGQEFGMPFSNLKFLKFFNALVYTRCVFWEMLAIWRCSKDVIPQRYDGISFCSCSASWARRLNLSICKWDKLSVIELSVPGKCSALKIIFNLKQFSITGLTRTITLSYLLVWLITIFTTAWLSHFPTFTPDMKWDQGPKL